MLDIKEDLRYRIYPSGVALERSYDAQFARLGTFDLIFLVRFGTVNGVSTSCLESISEFHLPM